MKSLLNDLNIKFADMAEAQPDNTERLMAIVEIQKFCVDWKKTNIDDKMKLFSELTK